MRKDLWNHPLVPFVPGILFVFWFTVFTLFGPMPVPYRVMSFLIVLIVMVWGLTFFRSRFFFEFQYGRFTVRQRVVEELSVLNRVLQVMNEEGSLQEVLRSIVDEAYHLVPTAQTSSFVIYNPERGVYEFVEVKSQSADFFSDLYLSPEDVEIRFKNRYRPFIDNNVGKNDQKLNSETRKKFEHYGVPQAILYIPIRVDGQLRGYITLDNWNDKNAFSSWDLNQIEKIQPQLVLAYTRAQRNAELKEYKAKLEQLYRAGQELATIDHSDGLIQHTLTLIRDTLHYNDICIFLIQGERLAFKGGYRSGEDEYVTDAPDMNINDGICGWVAQFGETAVVGDVTKDPRYLNRWEPIRSELTVPIRSGNEILGVLNLESTRMNVFRHEDEELMMTIASQLGIALSNLRHQSELRKAFLQIIEALARSIETKDNVTGGHCERMEDYALQIGENLGLAPERLENLRRAAILHDIGKIGVPGNILEKPGRLTEDEFRVMQEHPTFGANILREVDFLKDVAIIVEQHHERIDGRGYPYGLCGEEICLEARIISVVDAYDAMTSDRPYRRALSKEEAIGELKKHIDTQFDREVVGLLIKFLTMEKN